MSSLSISTAWDQTRSILARDGQLYAAVALALIVLPEVIFAVVGAPGPQASLLTKVIYTAVLLLGFVAQIALNRLAIGPSVTVGTAIRTGFARVGSVIVVLVLFSVALMIVAVVLLMVLGATRVVTIPAPGQAPPSSLILLLVLLVALGFAIVQLAFPVAAVETGHPLRIISRSWELAKGHYARLLGFIGLIIFSFILLVAATQYGVGSAVQLALGPPKPGTLSALVLGLAVGLVQAPFTVIAATMLARIYTQLSGRGEAQASVPSSGT